MSVVPVERTDMKMRCAFVVTPSCWLVTPPPPQANTGALGKEPTTHATITAPILHTRFILHLTQKEASSSCHGTRAGARARASPHLAEVWVSGRGKPPFGA